MRIVGPTILTLRLVFGPLFQSLKLRWNMFGATFGGPNPQEQALLLR